MPWRFLGKWMNSNIQSAVTDGPFSAEIRQGCTFNPKKEIPYWHDVLLVVHDLLCIFHNVSQCLKSVS